MAGQGQERPLHAAVEAADEEAGGIQPVVQASIMALRAQAGRTLYGKHRVETAEGRRTGGGHHQADLPAPAAPLLCHAPAGARHGHQDSEGTDGA